MKREKLAQEIVLMSRDNVQNVCTRLGAFDASTNEKMFAMVTEFVLSCVRERLTHPYQYAEELRPLLHFMKEAGRSDRLPELSEEEQRLLLNATLGLEKGILLSQFTQNFGVSRDEAAVLVKKLLPVVLRALGKKMYEKNGPERLLLALGVENSWLFLHVEALFSVWRREARSRRWSKSSSKQWAEKEKGE